MEYEIKPKEKFSLGFKELLLHRELLYFFIWREIKVKYKQTALGILWVIFQPAILMLITTFLLGSKIETGNPNIPYPVFFLSGYICWNIFSSALNNAGSSMVSNAAIIKKIYFPRLIIPISSVAAAFFDFLFGIIFYAGVLLYFDTPLNYSGLVFFPLSLLLVFFAAFGAGTLISALNVKYRDFRYLLPFFVQALLFASPVFYDVVSGSTKMNYLLALNPMFAPLELARAHLFDSKLHLDLVFISLLSNFIILLSGILFFRKTENYFADIA